MSLSFEQKRLRTRSFVSGHAGPTHWIRSAVISVGVIGIASVIVWGILRFFTVQTIVCTEAKRPCDPNILTFFSAWKGKYIFGSFEFDVPTKQGTVQRKLPHTLLITIDTPIVLMHVYTDPSMQSSVSLYSDGTIVKDVDTSKAKEQTVVIVDDSLRQMEGKKLTAQQITLYQTLLNAGSALPAFRVHIISLEEIEIETTQKITAIVSAANLDAKLHSLQLILTSPTIEQKPARVDLRFDRPVLRYL